MIGPNDSFGCMMSSNLADAGFHIPGFKDFPSLLDQVNRFKVSNKWLYASSCSMADAYHRGLSADEKVEANSVERLDEFEEFDMLMAHYCVTISTNNEDYSEILQIIPSP